MFERYSEQARRVIFFSRYEASAFGSPYIEAEHILLGLLRECQAARDLLAHQTAAAVRESLERNKKPEFATSVDLPLSQDAKRLLSFAADEAEISSDREIDCHHVLLGFLRLQTSAIHGILEKHNGPLTFCLPKHARCNTSGRIKHEVRLTSLPVQISS